MEIFIGDKIANLKEYGKIIKEYMEN